MESEHFFTNSLNKNPFIWTKENSLSKEFCDKVIEKFDKDERSYVGKIKNFNVDLNVKKSLDLHISYLDDWAKEDKIFCESLAESLKLYQNHLLNNSIELMLFPFIFYSNVIDWGYQIQKTVPGGFYTWHVDYDMSSSGYARWLTYIWYLNDVDDGGETEFYDGTVIKPKAGTILLFPSTWTYVHRGCKLKSGVKYICTGWMSHK